MTLEKYNPERLVVFSRDEIKQWDMQKVYQNDSIESLEGLESLTTEVGGLGIEYEDEL